MHSDITRFTRSDILFASSNLQLGEAKYHCVSNITGLSNRTCEANRTKKPQPKSVEVFLWGG